MLALLTTWAAALLAAEPADTRYPKSPTTAKAEIRRLRAAEAFDYRQPVIFQDAFASGQLAKWNLSEDDRYSLLRATPERIQVVDAPGLENGKKAVRFTVPRAPNSFRAEISLPHESGFKERWYGERIYVPEDWVFDATRGNDIVMQWHAIPGNWRVTYPNLELSIGSTGWFIRQSYGTAQTKPTRTNTRLDDPVERGKWVSWVIHAKWSPTDKGLLRIWKDGKLVMERKGPNVYSTIGMEYTPYLKTGIYHPEWHLDRPDKKEAFDQEKPASTKKEVYVTDVKIGDEQARYEDVAPAAIDGSNRRFSEGASLEE